MHHTRLSSGHPEELSLADAPYFAPWGRGEILRWSLICALLCGVVGLAVALHSWLWAVAWGPLGAFWAFQVLFFRNPAREVPVDSDILVSPADGTVWDIEEIASSDCDDREFVGEGCLRVGIFLSVFNVHVNRAPCDARVAYVKYRQGEFRDARSADCARVNESNTLGLEIEEEGAGRGVKLLLRQISGAIARRIVCSLGVDTDVRRGGLIGMIKYGSRTEVWVPLSAGFVPAVKVGDKVDGGSSVLGRFARPGEPADDSPQEGASD